MRGLVGLLLLMACEQSAPVATPPDGTNEEQAIFTQNKEFTYLASRFSKSGERLALDTVILISQGTIWDVDSTQKVIGWENRTSGARGGTGVAEGAGGVWIHPPRFDAYAILELSPFPEVKKPFVAGQEWDWELEVGDHYANPAWAVWKGGMLVKSHYKATGTQVVTTAFGQLKCQEVTAVAHCAQGSSTLRTLFHPSYGFVLLDYTTIDGGRLTLELRHAGVSNVFDGGAFYKQK